MAVYFVVDIAVRSSATKADYMEYVRKVGPLVVKHGGRYLTQGGKIIPLTGDWGPERIIIIEFPSLVHVNEWWNSPEYRAIATLRERSTFVRAILVEGVPAAIAAEKPPVPEQPVWHWNELQQVGTDYASVGEVERYEKRMGELRDLPAEDAAILKALDLPEHSHILEIGTGTGHFARAAAKAGHRVMAVDVSSAMLHYAEERAAAEGLTGIEFRYGGFLTFTDAPAKYDAAVSVAVLHHLPDLWKAIALEKLHARLKPGGRFLLGDVVFASSGGELADQFDAFVDVMPELMQPAAAGHVAKEYSTLDWIMEGLLTRAGFTIEAITPLKASFVQYLCRA
jgi:uncharacterized protein (DUF1330 family)/SAM-dependent methyltransferase